MATEGWLPCGGRKLIPKKESIYFQALADFWLGFLAHRKKMLRRG
jgi:hypothetical protein